MSWPRGTAFATFAGYPFNGERSIKPLFRRGPSENIRLTVFVTVSLLLMTLDHRFQHLESLRAALSVVVSPVQFAMGAPNALSAWFGQLFATRQSLQQDNDTLKSRYLLQEARLQKMAALEAENMRLRALLDSSFKVTDRVLVAELMEVDLEPFSQQIVINKGSNQGVFAGQPLVDAAGVIGQVVHVGPFSSTAMLITDPSHALPVWINRSGLRAIAVGTGAPGKLALLHLPVNADVEPGDLLVTSGLGGRFPSGYPVGIVEEVDRNPAETFAVVTAKPVAKLEQNREVLLVWGPPAPQAPACDAASEPCTDAAPAAAAEER